MATSPKFPPDEENRRDDHAHLVLTRKRTNPWPLVLVIIAAIILIALIAWVVLSKPRRTSSALANQSQHVIASLRRTSIGVEINYT